MSSIPRPPVYRIIILQLVLTLIAAALAWIHSDVAAKSALLGGLTALCFGVIFQRVEPLNVLALFAGFMTVQLGHIASARIANL